MKSDPRAVPKGYRRRLSDLVKRTGGKFTWDDYFEAFPEEVWRLASAKAKPPSNDEPHYDQILPSLERHWAGMQPGIDRTVLRMAIEEIKRLQER